MSQNILRQFCLLMEMSEHLAMGFDFSLPVSGSPIATRMSVMGRFVGSNVGSNLLIQPLCLL
jgi:hypothetical protein